MVLDLGQIFVELVGFKIGKTINHIYILAIYLLKILRGLFLPIFGGWVGENPGCR
jgi:hypothetical protein